MALSFASATGNLFNRLGRLFGSWANVETHQNAVIPNLGTQINAQYAAKPAYIPGLQPALTNSINASGQIKSELVTELTATLVNMIQADTPQPAASLDYSLLELIDQMNDAGATVNATTVGITATPDGANNGNGTCLVSVVDGQGRTLENVYAETINLTCTADSQPGNGGTTVGSEVFVGMGQLKATTLDPLWPTGSGGQTTAVTANPAVDGSTNNLLTNGDFESFTTNTPDSWTIVVGTAGTTVKSTSTSYQGSSALEIVGTAGAIRTRLSQSLRAAPGTPGSITPQTRYAVGCYVRMSTASAGGTLRIALRDGTTDGAAVIGGASITVALSALTTGYVFHNFQVNTPAVLSDNIYLVVELTVAADSGTSVYLDDLSLVQMARHLKGPLLAVFGGNSKFIKGDNFALAVTNNRAGRFQEFFNRAFNMDGRDLLLPSDMYGAETILDTLISA